MNSLPKATILFVDDETAILASLASLFRREEYRMQFESSGQAALTWMQDNPVDIIISDMRMPVMNGREFLEKARAIAPDATRIMLSGYEEKTVVLKGLLNGLAHRYIMKPWEDKNFRALLAEIVELRETVAQHGMRDIVTSLSSLPAFRADFAKLLGMLEHPETGVDEIVAQIELNVPISLSMLSVTHSISYPNRRQPGSLIDPVSFIGPANIADLVNSVRTCEPSCPPVCGGCRDILADIWRISAKRASFARRIAQQTPDIINPSTAFLASLLQDVGKAVRLCSERKKFLRFNDLRLAPGETENGADVSIFGIPHALFGSIILRALNIPEAITGPVARSHDESADDPVVRIMQIADGVASDGAILAHDPTLDPLIQYWRGELADAAPNDLQPLYKDN